jgi:hypothetical protein
MVGAALDIMSTPGAHISDNCKIIYGLSSLFSLANVLFLIRVSKDLSFLVILMTRVVEDLKWFIVLFSFFVYTFGVCYAILEVDAAAYGRLPYLLGLSLSTLRSAFGDFSMLDPYQGFDIQHEDPVTGEFTHSHSTYIVAFTFMVWIFQSFILFMVFMNFIIAVIGDSYASVIEFRDAHDYKIRIGMIFERELFLDKSVMNN